MPITIVVGGQYGSEGKGKVCSYLAEKEHADIMVRCGGSNSGHTVIHNDKPVIFRHLASGALNTNCRLLIPAGAYVDVKVIMNEIESHNIDHSRIGIDANTVVIKDEYIHQEKDSGLRDRIGSTLSGTGAAVSARINREDSVILAKDHKELKNFVTNVAEEVIQSNHDGKKIIIEGTQGFGLSVYHSPHYPFTTSRDTTASGFASEVGISPLDVDEVVMVIRAFPIRVAGNSGPLVNETSWEQITENANATCKIEERTSVTNKIRRVGTFDHNIVIKAIIYNKPTKIFLNHLDYLDSSVFSRSQKIHESQIVNNFLYKINILLDTPINFIGFGPKNNNIANTTKFHSTELFEVQQ